MNPAFSWSRPFQLIGLLLIGVLSIGAETATASNTRPVAEDVCWDKDGCRVCENLLSKCRTWICPVGDPRGIGISCPKK